MCIKHIWIWTLIFLKHQRANISAFKKARLDLKLTEIPRHWQLILQKQTFTLTPSHYKHHISKRNYWHFQMCPLYTNRLLCPLAIFACFSKVDKWSCTNISYKWVSNKISLSKLYSATQKGPHFRVRLKEYIAKACVPYEEAKMTKCCDVQMHKSMYYMNRPRSLNVMMWEGICIVWTGQADQMLWCAKTYVLYEQVKKTKCCDVQRYMYCINRPRRLNVVMWEGICTMYMNRNGRIWLEDCVSTLISQIHLLG